MVYTIYMIVWVLSDIWRGAGVVERGGLENRCALAHRGFESHPLRQAVLGWILSLANKAKYPAIAGRLRDGSAYG